MKAIRVADLKSHLSEHLRSVRRGHSVTVLDRDTPIAEIIPYRSAAASLPARQPKAGGGKPSDVRLPPPLKLRCDPVALLLEDRQKT